MSDRAGIVLIFGGAALASALWGLITGCAL
jgi:hypothetical protein